MGGTIDSYYCNLRLTHDVVVLELEAKSKRITVAEQALTVTVPERLAFVGQ